MFVCMARLKLDLVDILRCASLLKIQLDSLEDLVMKLYMKSPYFLVVEAPIPDKVLISWQSIEYRNFDKS